MVQYRTSEELLQNKEELKKYYMNSVSWAVKSEDLQKIIKNDLEKDAYILDIGCGGGHFLKMLKDDRYNNIYGFDISNYAIFDDIKDCVITGNLNFEKINYENGKFDLVTAFQVMEHLENPFHFARECARLLKPGGMLIMSIPGGKSLWSRISYFKSNNITGFNLVNDHISFLTEDVFTKTFLRDFEKEKEIYDPGFIPYLKIRTKPHKLLSKRICYFLRKK